MAAELGFATETEDDALRAVAETLGLEVIDLSDVRVDLSLLKHFPIRLIHRHGVFPVWEQEGSLVLATGNPFDLHALDAVSAAVGRSVLPVLASPADLSKLIKTHLGVGAETIDGLIAQQEGRDHRVEMLEEIDCDGSEGAEIAQEASVVRLVNEILVEAVEARASDIHLETQAAGMKIRYRIDGVLLKQPAPPEINRFQAAIISRLKIMARLNIAEKRVPQDGRIKLRVSGREIDIRVSIIPMLHGEGVVMRILDKDRMQFSLRGVGMDEDTYATFQPPDPAPARHPAGHGPHGLGQDHHALQRAERDQERRDEDHHHRRPDRVPAGGHQPDPGPPQGRADLRLQPAEHPAPRSRRDPGRRDSRPGDGRERHPGLADRAPGVQHPAHQRRGRRVHATGRHGRRAVPGGQHRGRRDGPAARPRALPRVPAVLLPAAGRAARRFPAGRVPRPRRADLPHGWVPEVPGDGLRGADRPVRV